METVVDPVADPVAGPSVAPGVVVQLPPIYRRTDTYKQVVVPVVDPDAVPETNEQLPPIYRRTDRILTNKLQLTVTLVNSSQDQNEAANNQDELEVYPDSVEGPDEDPEEV